MDEITEALDNLIASTQRLDRGRESALVITKLQEAAMWYGAYLFVKDQEQWPTDKDGE